jgi:hypothetical protein
MLRFPGNQRERQRDVWRKEISHLQMKIRKSRRRHKRYEKRKFVKSCRELHIDIEVWLRTPGPRLRFFVYVFAEILLLPNDLVGIVVGFLFSHNDSRHTFFHALIDCGVCTKLSQFQEELQRLRQYILHSY